MNQLAAYPLLPSNKKDKVVIDDEKMPFEIWEAASLPKDNEFYFRMSKFALMLNNLTPQLKKKLPPTDSRLRPDQRALEEGNIDFAASEKQRLEEKQRGKRAWREANPGNDF